METTRRILTKSSARRNLLREIARQRNRVLDWEIAVADERVAIDRHMEGLRAAVRERDRRAAYLTYLLELHEEIEAVGETVSPAVAFMFSETTA